MNELLRHLLRAASEIKTKRRSKGFKREEMSAKQKKKDNMANFIIGP